MRVLLVEDEPAFRDRLQRELSQIDGVVISTAASRSSAMRLLDSTSFDLVVCDLKIPPDDGGLDTAEEHGFEVYETVRKKASGTCAYFLTGFATQQNTRDRLAEAPQADIFGTKSAVPLTRLRTKEELVDFIAEAEAFAAALKELDTVVVEADVDLDLDELRALRVFARRLGGSRVEAFLLGGLSGARNLRAIVYDDSGGRRAVVFCKIGDHDRIRSELENYHQHVPSLLPIGSYPAHADQVFEGAGRRAGVFYRLAEEYDKDLFSLAIGDEASCVAAVEMVEGHLHHWSGTRGEVTCSVGVLRRERISDEVLENYLPKLGEVCSQFEEVVIDLPLVLQHGDLHGANVLVGAGRAILIDFGDVRLAPVAYDAISMELSFLFHPESSTSGTGWPVAGAVQRWFDLAAYLEACPVSVVVARCRAWAMREAPSDLHLAAVVYAHAVRMLKYPNVDALLAVELARASASFGLASTML